MSAGKLSNRKNLVGIVLTILASGSGSVLYWYDHLPIPQTSYCGVSLSDRRIDVEYKLGVPTYVLGPTIESGSMEGFSRVYDVFGDPNTDKNALIPRNSYKSFLSWEYNNLAQSGSVITVSFLNSGQVDKITCESENDLPGSCPPILGINVDDTEAQVREVLGNPTETHLDVRELPWGAEHVYKRLLYKRLNVILVLSRQRVDWLEISTNSHEDQF